MQLCVMEWIGKCCSTRRSTAAALVAAHLMEHYKACSSSRGIRVAESLDAAAAATSNSNCVQQQVAIEAAALQSSHD